MIKNILLISIRNMMKNRLFIFINIFGLAVSIACCVVAYFLYDFNASFDHYHKNISNTYRVSSIREFQGQTKRFAHAPLALGNAIKDNVPEVEKVVRYNLGFHDFKVDDDVFNEVLGYADDDFFNLFTFEFIEGNGKLTNNNQIIISEDLAIKHFGKGNVLGRELIQSLDSGRTRPYVISGVFKRPPANSSFGEDAYVRFDTQLINNPEFENSWADRTNLFIQINDPSRIDAIEQQIDIYKENNNKAREDFIIKQFEIEPFAGMAVRDGYEYVQGSMTRNGAHIAAIYGTAIMSIFILLIACFNLTNTAVAVSSKRLKEIGIRKVMGSTRRNLIAQFIGETMLICLFSLLLGIIVGELFLIPAFNSLWTYWELSPDYFGKPNFLIFMGFTLAITGLLAGSYPALYVSKFQPVAILKDKLKLGGNNFFTRVLLTVQFGISIIGIVCSIAFINNAEFQKNYDLGYNKNGVTYTYLNSKGEYETFKNRLLENRNIISVSGSKHHVNNSSFKDPIKSEGQETEVIIMDVGDNYAKTLGFTISQGRDFILDSETDKEESILITEKLATQLAWADPIGKEITWKDTVHYRVVGVLKDILPYGLMGPAEPMMLRYQGTEDVHYIIASAPITNIKEVQDDMEEIYRDMFPERVPNIVLMDEQVVASNEINNNILKMFVFLGAVALLLSATGLFAMVSLSIVRKLKEIGVRKVLGASAANLTKVINLEFMIILLIASALGSYAGGWMAGMLMNSIWTYFQQTTIVTLFTASGIMIATAALTIGYKVFKTIKLNPSHILRSE